MPIFYLMCGIPASGKSTVAQKIAAMENAVILSPDDIRRELFKDNKYNLRQNKQVFRLFRLRLTEAFKSGENIVIDAINRRGYERKKYAERAKKKGYHTICVYCKKDRHYALYANNMRDEAKRVPDGVINTNCYFFTTPDKNEGWDEIRVNDGNKYSVEIERQIVKYK